MKYTVKLCPRTCIMESTYKGLKSVSLEQLIHFRFVIAKYVLNKFSSIENSHYLRLKNSGCTVYCCQKLNRVCVKLGYADSG